VGRCIPFWKALHLIAWAIFIAPMYAMGVFFALIDKETGRCSPTTMDNPMV
jgi:hypothetical protein